MNLIKLLSSSNVGYYNKEIARKLGLNEAILLSELCGKYEYYAKENKLTDDGYFFETQEMIEENTTLTPYQQRQPLKNLEKLGIIESKLVGLPATKYFKINEDKLSQYLTTRCEETSQLDMKKLDSSNKEYNKEDNKLSNNKLLDIKTTKKKSLYEKCVDEIYNYSSDDELNNALISYLSVRLSMKDKPIYGVNQWKGMLKKLHNMHGDLVAIVNQSIERGWATFVEIKQYKNSKYSGPNVFCEYDVKSHHIEEGDRNEESF